MPVNKRCLCLYVYVVVAHMYSPVICLAVFRLTLRISGQSVTVRSFEPSISKHEAGLFFSRPLHYHNTNILTRQQMNFFPVFD